MQQLNMTSCLYRLTASLQGRNNSSFHVICHHCLCFNGRFSREPGLILHLFRKRTPWERCVAQVFAGLPVIQPTVSNAKYWLQPGKIICHPFFVYRGTPSCLIYVVSILNSLWLLSTHCSYILTEYLSKGQIKASSDPDAMSEICAVQTDMHVPLWSVLTQKARQPRRWYGQAWWWSNVAFLLAFTSSS